MRAERRRRGGFQDRRYRIGFDVEQRLGRHTTGDGDDEQLAMAARQPLRHVGGDREARS